MLAANARLHTPAVTSPHRTDVGPPDGNASDKEAARAVHEFKIANARPSMPTKEKLRSREACWAESRMENFRGAEEAIVILVGRFSLSFSISSTDPDAGVAREVGRRLMNPEKV